METAQKARAKSFWGIIALGIVLFWCNNTLAQTQCFVIFDSVTHEYIPYCNIETDKGEGFVTNHLGEFCIKLSDNDSILIIGVSNIAYHKKSVAFFKNKPDSIIYLQPKLYNINEIDINWSNYKFTWIGNTTKIADSYINLWRFCQLGIHISPLQNRLSVLETISIPIQNTNTEKVPFRLHVFDVDSLGGVGNDLLPENVYGNLKDAPNGIIELDVLKYQIKIPEKGLFITVELLSNNKPNELQHWDKTYYEKNNNRIGVSRARYRHRNMLKVSAWKPNKFYVEPYPFTNVPGLIGDLPLIKVKVRQLNHY